MRDPNRADQISIIDQPLFRLSLSAAVDTLLIKNARNAHSLLLRLRSVHHTCLDHALPICNLSVLLRQAMGCLEMVGSFELYP